jgi:hypothetical protein
MASAQAYPTRPVRIFRENHEFFRENHEFQ